MAPSQFFKRRYLMDVQSLLKRMELTRGRITPRAVFQDFIAMCALLLSGYTDPVHYTERAKALAGVAKRYSSQEQVQLMATFCELTEHYEGVSRRGQSSDLLGNAFAELGLTGKLGQDFSPGSIPEILSRITLPTGRKLPETGFFTIMDTACGSGVLALGAAQRIADLGFNPCLHMVMQASDIDLRCVYMTYVQLSFHGFPAVVIHGDTLTLKEYSRWYTPAYILGKWVWRCPMPFSGGRSWSDELLKMADEPIYGALRAMEWGLLGEKKQGGAAG